MTISEDSTLTNVTDPSDGTLAFVRHECQALRDKLGDDDLGVMIVRWPAVGVWEIQIAAYLSYVNDPPELRPSHPVFAITSKTNVGTIRVLNIECCPWCGKKLPD